MVDCSLIICALLRQNKSQALLFMLLNDLNRSQMIVIFFLLHCFVLNSCNVGYFSPICCAECAVQEKLQGFQPDICNPQLHFIPKSLCISTLVYPRPALGLACFASASLRALLLPSVPSTSNETHSSREPALRASISGPQTLCCRPIRLASGAIPRGSAATPSTC